MRRIFALVVSIVFGAQAAFADDCATKLMPLFNSFQATKLCGTLVPQVPGSDNSVSIGTASRRIKDFWSAGSISVDTFQNLYSPVNVVTVASTPVADVNMCDGRFNSITSASANNACISNDADGIGKGPDNGCNFSGQTIRVKGGAGITTNASSVAGAYFSVTDGTCWSCYRVSSTKRNCWLHAQPTISASP